MALERVFSEEEFVEILGSCPQVAPIPGQRGGPTVPVPVQVAGQQGRVCGFAGALGSYVVQLFDHGLRYEIPGEHLAQFEPAPGQRGGFDACWPLEEFGEIAAVQFAEDVSKHLLEQGFCVVQMFMTEEDRQAALEESMALKKWKLPKKEFEASYMGQDNGDKMCIIKQGDYLDEPENALERCNQQLSLIGLALEAVSNDALDIKIWGRVDAFLRAPLMNQYEAHFLRPEPLTRKDYDDGLVVGHVHFLERRKLFVLYNIDNNGGKVVLFPHGESPEAGIKIPLERNTMILVRTDELGYSYKPEGNSLAMQTWFVTQAYPHNLEEQDNMVSLPVLLHGNRVHAMSLATRLPGEALGMGAFWSMLLGGVDGLTTVPTGRWDMNAYYSEERTPNGGTSYAMHGGFVSDFDIIGFDNDFFSIAKEEAERMSPGQRVVLETGFEILHQAGHSKQSVRGLTCGTFLGDSGNDWQYMCGAQDAFKLMGMSNCVTGSRLSHCLGLRGPISVVDTACSSSMTAVCLAHSAMRKTGTHQKKALVHSHCRVALAIGCNLLLSPRMYILYCGPGMLSPRGRSFTFDASGDGYARGEGCGGLMLQYSDTDEDLQGMLACLVGSAVNQDGRSASMTAPNGPAQQVCIRTSISESGLSPCDIRVAECHGTGTALGDPIEVSALRSVMEDRKSPILATSAKTNIGHLEACAGITGLLKCVMLVTAASSPPNVHLETLNPHLDTTGYPAYFETDLADLGENASLAGVSSFGFGGTNARGDIWSRCLRGHRETSNITSAAWLVERSNFYQRIFNHEKPGPHHNDRVFALGSWDAFGAAVELEKTGPGMYMFLCILGETCCEQFRLVLNQDNAQCIHPENPMASAKDKVVGPDNKGKGKNWVISGRPDNSPCWTIYQVRFEWSFSWEYGEMKKISWEPTDQVAPPKSRVLLHRHLYAIAGTWTSWRFQDMNRNTDEEGLWTTTVRIGLQGREEFQFVRDNDWLQALYPAVPNARRAGVPICGPDGHGKGKNWVLTGNPGEIYRIQLRLQVLPMSQASPVPTQISVTVAGDAGVKTWHNGHTGTSWADYYITGTWNDWTFAAMQKEKRKSAGVHRYVLRLGQNGYEEFCFVMERDWDMRLYPDVPEAQQGQAMLQGPDNMGHGLNWVIEGAPGSRWQITLDLTTEDRSAAVTWEMVARQVLPKQPALALPEPG